MRRPGPGPPSVPGRWADIIEEATATAEAYRDEGYDVVMLHPGDVVPIPDEVAFDVLLPGSEFEAVETLAESFDPEEVAVFTAQEGAFGYAVVVATDTNESAAICCPLYYQIEEINAFVEAAEDAGVVELHLRPLSRESQVVIALDETGLLFDGIA